MKMITEAEVRAAIMAAVEDDTYPLRAAAWCKANEGKRIARNRLPEGFHLYQSFGMTYLRTEDYARTDGRKGACILLGYSTVNVLVPPYDNGEHRRDDASVPRSLRTLNPSYYAGREQRTEAYGRMMGAPNLITEITHTINRIRIAQEALDDARRHLTDVEHASPAGFSHYVIDSLVEREDEVTA